MRVFALLVLALALAAPASGRERQRPSPDREQPRPQRPGYANPSAVIAAEIALNHLARDKGQWAAYREMAAPEAEFFVPQRVKAAEWLKGRAEPSTVAERRTQEVWMSCDGTYAVTRGSWRMANAQGFYFKVWQRQEKRGEYKWLLDQGFPLAEALPEPEMIAAHVADCSGTAPAIGVAASTTSGAIVAGETESSDDGTLAWTALPDPGAAPSLIVNMWRDGRMQDVLRAGAAIPQP